MHYVSGMGHHLHQLSHGKIAVLIGRQIYFLMVYLRHVLVDYAPQTVHFG
jgi:hypothetical protein